MASRKIRIAAVFFVVWAVTMLQSTSATTYIVGGSTGWTQPAANDFNFYYYWALNQTLMVGDVLQFNFVTGADDVATVTEEAYVTCTTANPIRTYTDAPVEITLKNSGDYYFISTFSGNCAAGERLAVQAIPNSTSSLVATFSLVIFVSISLLFSF